MSEFLVESHGGLLKEIIEYLCMGDTPIELINQFEQECESVSHDELAVVFEQLDTQGISFRDNNSVIDFYNEVVQEKIAAANLRQFPMGHPARVYLEENMLLRSWMKSAQRFKPAQQMNDFSNIFADICTVELHYQRKENQLFPCLEKHGWDSPSKNMWAFHDENRSLLKELRQAIEQGDAALVEQRMPFLFSQLERMMQVEEQRLIPGAMDLLDDEDWLDMQEGDREIGWMLDKEPPPFPPVGEDDAELEAHQQENEQPASHEQYVHPSKVKRKKKLPFDTTGMFHFDEGYMTPEQVNLIFKVLPLDITYVDENGKVLFYNRGEERLFPRSAGIIGREVHHCHPPKSVDTVLRIVEEFRKGTRDVADFRIHIKGRFVVIRYFAVRDDDKNYRGVVEMSQDITDIQTLEGEQRLLDWG